MHRMLIENMHESRDWVRGVLSVAQGLRACDEGETKLHSFPFVWLVEVKSLSQLSSAHVIRLWAKEGLAKNPLQAWGLSDSNLVVREGHTKVYKHI